MKVGFISLGCNKNLVDTEKTIALFKEHGLNKAIEAINTILEMAEYKKQNCKYLIAMGCLVERYKSELEKEIPEVDLYIKYSSYNTLWEQINNLLKNKQSDALMKDKQNNNATKSNQLYTKSDNLPKTTENNKAKINNQTFDEYTNRVITTGNNYAYIKIADGCSNRCTYCAIPYIRGPLKSRTMESIIKEAKQLAEEGYEEIILTAQDTTKYGIDIYKKPMLANLLAELCKLEKIKWIRFLYAYPETITNELIEVIKQNPKICHYFDIPIQHISNNVLKRMNRQSNGESIKKLIAKLRKEIPDVILRTTVMVGFPGETKEDFDELYNFLQEAKFDKLGAFAYSKEEGTPAYNMKDQIHPSTKKSRYNKIMSLQQQISHENLEKNIGKTFEVIIEGITKNKKYYVGRSYMDTPEIDGVIYIENTKSLKEGSFVLCKITKVKDYDLIGKLLN